MRRAKSGDGPVQIARMYKLTKGSAVKARTQAINQLKAVFVTADPDLREELSRLNNPELFRICARLADDSRNDEGGEEAVLQATRITLCLLAQRIGQLTEQIQELERRSRSAAWQTGSDTRCSAANPAASASPRRARNSCPQPGMPSPTLRRA